MVDEVFCRDIIMATYRQKLGAWGEQLAQEFLAKQGYRPVDSNWAKRRGEIDLICEKEKELVFVEVKTRASQAFGFGEQAVTWLKKQKIKKTMNQFLLENKKFDDYFPRFDIIVVELYSLKPNFVHFENVELG